MAKKVQISIDDSLLDRIDNYADNNYLTRSGLITLATNQYLNSAEVITAIKDMSVSMRKIADQGSVDKQTMEQLEDFERIANVLVGANK